ncbi:MAG: TonB-dependent receptor [Bryobacteraceae bacterium]|jgi:outer membrane cobalamin receptor
MYRRLQGLAALLLLFSAGLPAASLQGTVADPSGAPVVGAQVAVSVPAGIAAQTLTGVNGSFELDTAVAKAPDAKLVVTAPGFRTAEILLSAASQPLTVKLQLAPLEDSVSVVGSAIDVPASQQGGSTSIVTSEEIRRSNLAQAVDLLRYLPGIAISQTGFTGGLTSLYLRGGYDDFNLVEIDGIPVNSFGGGFDFAHIPAEELDRVEVIRGPESAVAGEYANSGVVNFVTREAGAAPNLDILAEGGTYQEHRFGIAGGDTLAGFGIAVAASRLDDNGPVPNSDYRNENLMLNLLRRFGSQSLNLHGDFDSNSVGEPGPYGSDPNDDYTGLDTISRSKNNFSDYLAHYQADLFSGRIKEDLVASFFLNNNGYTSPYGFSFNKDLRGQAEWRMTTSVKPWYTVALGTVETTEEVRNTYITDANSDTFPIRRNDIAFYVENRFQLPGGWTINAGVRGEFLDTGNIPADGASRPYFPAQSVSAVDPKVAAAYSRGGTRLHASFGTGFRPPAGFDLAYTDNPSLKPERTRGFDAGVERRFFHDVLSLDATFFDNRYYDLIVILGGNLSVLSHYESDNLANSRGLGTEYSARLRPTRWLYITGWYTWLDSEILSLNGTANLAPAPFTVGQQLLRCPANSGAFAATFTRGRVSGGLDGYFRGSILDVDPSYGASAGLFQNPGYANLGLNLNYKLGRGLTAYGNLRNALDQHYEEVFGYPSPRLNFVTGFKWSLTGAK